LYPTHTLHLFPTIQHCCAPCSLLQEASSTEDLLAASCGVAAGDVAAMEGVPPGGSRAVYELTAMVVLIRRVGWASILGCCVLCAYMLT